VLSGTSGKAHHAWLIPPGELGHVVVEIVGKALKDVISETWVSENSGGSDSSTGST
jgi:hypothetical protein